MSEKIVQTAGRESLGEFAPMFAHLNDDVLFGEVWLDKQFRKQIDLGAVKETNRKRTVKHSYSLLHMGRKHSC